MMENFPRNLNQNKRCIEDYHQIFPNNSHKLDTNWIKQEEEKEDQKEHISWTSNIVSFISELLFIYKEKKLLWHQKIL